MHDDRDSSDAGDIADDDLSTRARMHAALGEPVRLAIVDRLTLGDASPGELGAATGLATNLLAHHLRVMEEAGLIRRARSEGDRRRSYVQLRWDDDLVARLVSASTADSLLAEHVPRVLFVCTHNSARSQLAARAWALASNIPVACAGTHPAPAVHPLAVEVAQRHGLHLDATSTHRLADTVEEGDLIVAVCDNAHEQLAVAAASDAGFDAEVTPRRSWLHWAVPDPVRVGSDDAFEVAYADLTHRIHRLASALEPSGPSKDPTPIPRPTASIPHRP